MYIGICYDYSSFMHYYSAMIAIRYSLTVLVLAILHILHHFMISSHIELASYANNT